MQGNGLDLAALDTKKGAEEGFQLELRHPTTKKPLGIWIHVLGSDSDAYRAHMDEVERQISKAVIDERRTDFTHEEKQAREIEHLIAVTRGWSDNITLDGAKLSFSQDAARKLYARFRWIREQLDKAVHDRANFLPSPGGGS